MNTANKNNFDGVRIGLALIVVFSHLAALTQLPEFKIFESIFNANFAVKGFFAISGFLVTKSYLSSKSVVEYAEKRLRRIYPAYISAIILCLFIGIFTTTLKPSDFLLSPETLKYLLYNAIFLNFLQPTLPSVFDNNPIQALNGSLWTIKIEVMLYCFIPPVVFLFTRLGSVKTSAFIFLLSVAWVYFFTFSYTESKGELLAKQFPGQFSYFVFGSLLAINNNIFSNLKFIALASIVALFITNNAYAKLFIDPIAYSSIVIFLSTTAAKSYNLGKYGDISYGLYLYHFPIIQSLIFLGLFRFNIWLGFIATFILTTTAALASWHLIEKRVLKRTSHYIVASRS